MIINRASKDLTAFVPARKPQVNGGLQYRARKVALLDLL